MDWRRVFRVLLEPAKDPLRDSFGISVERVRELRIRLSEQLLQAERRVNGELDAHHARQDLLNARQTAAKALQHLQDLMIVLDDAHARAAALAETLYRDE
jgi:regulator of protease activity HflC (stomatin/prohibitin superfamily)